MYAYIYNLVIDLLLLGSNLLVGNHQHQEKKHQGKNKNERKKIESLLPTQKGDTSGETSFLRRIV